MVLALDYMNKTNTARPGIRAHALEKIDVGYKRLLGFEVKSEPGGFDWWGKPPANLFLSAYGLMEFRNMAEVYPVAPALIERIVAYLRSKQSEDGSWSTEGVKGAWSTDMAKGRSFFLTAYVAWGMARAGQPSEKALAWLEANRGEADDAYGLALASLAFLTADPGSAVGHELADDLLERSRHDDQGIFWMPTGSTGVGARGTSATIETTALAIQALLLDGRYPEVAMQAVDRLAAWRGKDGRFGTTQSTILALEALIAAEIHRKPRGDLKVRIGDGHELRFGVDLPATSTSPERVEFGEAGPKPIEVVATGEGRVRATVARTSWVSWNPLPKSKGRLDLQVKYPAGDLTVGEPAKAHVLIRNTTPDKLASVVTIEVGIPPGCTVEPRDVKALDAKGRGAERIERGETTIVIYLRDLKPGEAKEFRILFTPRYELDVVTAPSTAYEYYVPEEAVLVPPRPVKAVRKP